MLATASFTRPADTTAYASGDLVANSTTAGSVTPLTFNFGQPYREVLRVRVLTSSTSVTNTSFRLHLYSNTPASIANGDNGAWSTSAAGYIGALDVTLDRAFTDGAFGSGLSLTQTPVTREDGQSTLYGLLEARAAYTPTNAGTFTVTLEVA